MKFSTKVLLLCILHATFAAVFLVAGDLLFAHGDYLEGAVVGVLPLMLAFFGGMYAIIQALAREQDQ